MSRWSKKKGPVASRQSVKNHSGCRLGGIDQINRIKKSEIKDGLRRLFQADTLGRSILSYRLYFRYPGGERALGFRVLLGETKPARWQDKRPSRREMWYEAIWREDSEIKTWLWGGWMSEISTSKSGWSHFCAGLKLLTSDKHISDPKLRAKQKRDNCTKWHDTDTKGWQQDCGPVQALDQVGGSLSSDRESWIRQLEFHICRSSNYLTAASEELPWRAVRLSLRRVAFRDWQ